MQMIHIDADSFYASCEIIFRPDLQNKPVVVLTNNDTVIISLNKKAKQIGLERGFRLFEHKALCKQHNVVAFSSNYTLYADISRRITEIYMEYSGNVEPYSIDECFLFFPDLSSEYLIEIAAVIREKIKKQTGISVSAGIAPTKTLAKFCNKLAKDFNGIYCYNPSTIDSMLANVKAEKIWNIGFGTARKFYSLGINTALQVKNFPPFEAKKLLGINGYNTVMELNGIQSKEKKEISIRDHVCSSRQFSVKVFTLEELEEAAIEYVASAYERMLASGASWTKGVAVFLSSGTNFQLYHAQQESKLEKQEEKYMKNVLEKTIVTSSIPEMYSNSVYFQFVTPTSSLPHITNTVLSILRKIYKTGYGYRKLLIDLGPLSAEYRQQDLFAYSSEDSIKETQRREKEEKISVAYSEICQKYGREALSLGLSGKKDNWEMKRRLLSPYYTTRLLDIPKISL